ncbi:MAG: type VI secretion system baseplate subunit TssE [Caulobacteraceae bacterium]
MESRDESPLNYGSLVDRLVDQHSDRAGDDLPSLARLRDGLRRDLEAMLNTRKRFLTWSSHLDQLDRSLVNYGLNDLTNESVASSDFREDFVAHVNEVLRRLEPRITNFEVVLLENAEPLDRTLRFRIVGQVTLGDERQELHFDSHIDPVKAGIVIRE